MRKILLLICLLFSLGCVAQNKHMKFMGIPIDGSVTQFQQKLAKKGFRPRTSYNKTSRKGIRVFDGVFAGYKASLLVNYTLKATTVYRACIILYCYSQSDFEDVYYNNFWPKVVSKYKDMACSQQYEDNGMYACKMCLYKDKEKGCDKNNYYGYVDVFSSYDNDSGVYTIFIQYTDDSGLNESEKEEQELKKQEEYAEKARQRKEKAAEQKKWNDI